jgi:hypothetical protein
MKNKKINSDLSLGVLIIGDKPPPNGLNVKNIAKIGNQNGYMSR